MSPAAKPSVRAVGLAFLVAGAGMVLAAAVALAKGDSFHDASVLAGVAAGGAAVAGVLGWIALTPLRRQPVGRQAVAVVLVVIVATAVGVMCAAQAMFISGHDLNALVVILIASGSAGAAAGMRLGARVDADSRAVGIMAQQLAEQTPRPAGGPTTSPPTQELARLADQITDVSSQLEEARLRERALEQSRRELIAWISHDLRGPLTSIRAMAEAMEDGLVDDRETVARYHTSIRLETERLAALVDDLFELSRITAGATHLRAERVPLADVVDEAIETISARAEQAGIRFDRQYQSLPSVEVSVPEFTRVLHNLLDNAIRHTPAGGTIVVEGEPEAGGAVVTVQDQCGGIPETDLSRVFDLAFRGDSARGRDGGGGLGLTIAKGLVEAHRGSLMVRNLPGGCRFTIELPGS